MLTNPLKQKLAQRIPVTGCMIQGCMPSLVEICGLAGFEFVFLDAETFEELPLAAVSLRP